jgi:hypothetical protein
MKARKLGLAARRASRAAGRCSPRPRAAGPSPVAAQRRPSARRRDGPRPSHPRQIAAMLLPSWSPVTVSSLRENHQRPNDTVLTPDAGGYDIPAAINSPGQPAGARSFTRAQGPEVESAHLPVATRHRVCRMADPLTLIRNQPPGPSGPGRPGTRAMSGRADRVRGRCQPH